jgi:hypothetical protein
MTYEQELDELRRIGSWGTATVVAAELANLAPDGLTQSTLIFYFKRAFPSIPLRVMIAAGNWRQIGGGMSDEEFDEMLRPWLPTAPGSGRP